jgi:putative redox protein
VTERDNVGQATVTLVDGLQMVGESGSGHAIVLDGAPGFGRNTGIRPMELLLLSLAGCTGMDVVHILGKRRVNVQHFQVRVNAWQAPTHPKVYTDIEVEYIVKGLDIKVKDLEMAIELSATAFCSVSAMLSKAARITHKYRLDGAEGERAATLEFE